MFSWIAARGLRQGYLQIMAASLLVGYILACRSAAIGALLSLPRFHSPSNSHIPRVFIFLLILKMFWGPEHLLSQSLEICFKLFMFFTERSKASSWAVGLGNWILESPSWFTRQQNISRLCNVPGIIRKQALQIYSESLNCDHSRNFLTILEGPPKTS